ncbi:MAG: hypothetical protein HPZ91_07235 [Lentisphaeria bacterium]|nr:hypothetical protein [Lentisphaeria bacterium]
MFHDLEFERIPRILPRMFLFRRLLFRLRVLDRAQNLDEIVFRSLPDIGSFQHRFFGNRLSRQHITDECVH